jgi:hypothetical protein
MVKSILAIVLIANLSVLKIEGVDIPFGAGRNKLIEMESRRVAL